jgi:hypothetical protein
VADLIADTPDERRRALGEAMRARVLAEHTAEVRAGELEEELSAISYQLSATSLAVPASADGAFRPRRSDASACGPSECLEDGDPGADS